MKIAFVLTYFGKCPWIEKYISNCNGIGGRWHWKIFTDINVKSQGNVEVIPMTLEQFAERVNAKFYRHPNYFFRHNGTPSFNVFGFFPAYGYMFDDYLKGFDFWGHTNLDVVYGRLDEFITDEFLSNCDIFGNDKDAINGIFSLYRNIYPVNNLFRQVFGWEKIYSDAGWYGFDEREFSSIVRDAHNRKEIVFKSAFWAESERTVDKRHIRFNPDGSIVNTRTNIETMVYHFSKTKEYPW
jgi:hypothetical protein